jgi:hypothetical protein
MENHPELRKGEVLLANCFTTKFNDIVYKSKRMGNRAYDINDVPIEGIEGFHPVFVSKKEYKEHVKN